MSDYARLRGKMPPHSCPDFDDAIKHIEEARSVNDKLRELLRETLDALETAETYIESLERMTESQQDTIEALRAELAAKETP